MRFSLCAALRWRASSFHFFYGSSTDFSTSVRERADAFACHHDVGHAVERRRVAVDYHELRSVHLRLAREVVRGRDDERRAEHYEGAAAAAELVGGFERARCGSISPKSTTLGRRCPPQCGHGFSGEEVVSVPRACRSCGSRPARGFRAAPRRFFEPAFWCRRSTF